MAQGVFLFLGFLAVLLFPSSNLQQFDGLPVSRVPEFAALIGTIPFLIFPELRRNFWDWIGRRKIPRLLFWILPAVGLAIKITLFAFGPSSGFAGCYRSPAAPTTISHEVLPERTCERSYENLFDRSSATRMDDTIWFGAERWNLVFLNTDRYNYYDWESGNIPRARIPIEAQWAGIPDVGPNQPIRIEYVGEGAVVWGGVRVELPPSYAGTNIVEVESPATASLLRIEYAFDDGSRSGGDSQNWGPRASIRVSAGAESPAVPLRAANPAAPWRSLAWLADGLILLWLLSFLPAIWLSVNSDWILLIACGAGIGLFSFLPVSAVVRETGLICVPAGVLIARLAVRPVRAVSIYFIVFLAGFAIMRVLFPGGIGLVLLRSAGNDPLSYESQAYSILATGSLQGGEPVFYNVPAYRYLKFLEHAIFGDGNMLAAAVLLAVFLGGVFRLFRDFVRRGSAWLHTALLIGLGGGLLFMIGYYCSTIIRDGLSEYGAWILFLWALPALFANRSGFGIIGGMTALSIAVTIRPDLLPGALWIFLIVAFANWRNQARNICIAAAAAICISLLPLAHNLYFGHQWVLFTTSQGAAVNLVLPPATWLAGLRGDPTAAAAIREQAAMLFLITDVPRSALPTMAVMAAFLFCWLALTGWTVIPRKFQALPWLAVPIPFLVIRFFYVINTYYPRHIFVIYFSMAVVSALVLIQSLRIAPAAAGPAVELPRT
jgi:hypothetical protein